MWRIQLSNDIDFINIQKETETNCKCCLIPAGKKCVTYICVKYYMFKHIKKKKKN